MGPTWNCSAGALQVQGAGINANVRQRSWQKVTCEAKQPLSNRGEVQILGYSLHSARKSGRKVANTEDYTLRCSVENNEILAGRKKFRTEFLKSEDTLEDALGNSFVSSNGRERIFNPASFSLSWSQRLQLAVTHANSNSSRSISSPSPGSPRFDSEEVTEFPEKVGRERNAFQEIGRDENGNDAHGDKWQTHRDIVDPADSSGVTVTFEEYGNSPRSELDMSDLFREESNVLATEEDNIWAAQDKLEHEEELSRGNMADNKGYESLGEQSDTSIQSGTTISGGSMSGTAADSLAIGGKEPVYQVLEVHPDGDVVQREVSRRQLLRNTAGLRLRDIRSVDPSLWVTNSVPAILVRDQAILLNLGSLRAIATSQSVLIFEHRSVGAQAFMAALLPRLRTASNGHGPIMPFELEVVEAALISRTQRLERMLMDVEPRVMSLLKVLPIRYTADVLEELRLGKQALVELAAKAGALRQMLLELLEHPQDIRKMTIMGRTCNIRRADGSIECSVPLDKQSAEDEEEEIEMLLEYYLQRCDSCHGQAEKLLDAAKEMEDSIGVNLSSRRLEVSRLELLLQVGTFCSALGALVAGIFGMNLKSYLEEHVMAFYITTAGIIFGGIALFFFMFTYLKGRKIL